MRHLERDGVIFRSTGDSEVVLHALHRWGPERAIPLFNGMFAIAYFDRRNDTLWLARDRVGIKPLYPARRRPRPRSLPVALSLLFSLCHAPGGRKVA